MRNIVLLAFQPLIHPIDEVVPLGLLDGERIGKLGLTCAGCLLLTGALLQLLLYGVALHFELSALLRVANPPQTLLNIRNVGGHPTRLRGIRVDLTPSHIETADDVRDPALLDAEQLADRLRLNLR